MDLVACLAQAPERSAIVLDVDGTLAPIVPRPEDARVPEEARAELERLARKYALLAFLSGRTGADAKRVVGLEGPVYVGVHGLELAPEAEQWREAVARVIAEAEWPVEDTEDKGLTAAFHWRSRDDAEVGADIERVAALATSAGLIPMLGRKVLDVRPPVAADKGTALQRLVADSGASRALYAGDDTTDLDAFRGLREADLELAVCVAVASEEGPAELRSRADLVVDGPAGLLALLHQL